MHAYYCLTTTSSIFSLVSGGNWSSSDGVVPTTDLISVASCWGQRSKILSNSLGKDLWPHPGYKSNFNAIIPAYAAVCCPCCCKLSKAPAELAPAFWFAWGFLQVLCIKHFNEMCPKKLPGKTRWIGHLHQKPLSKWCGQMGVHHLRLQCDLRAKLFHHIRPHELQVNYNFKNFKN